MLTARQEKVAFKPTQVRMVAGYPDQGDDQGIFDQQGHLLLQATPVVDDHGTVAYIAPAGSQFHVNEGDGRRVLYVRTTGYTPGTGHPDQPMPTRALRAEAPPQVTGRPNRLWGIHVPHGSWTQGLPRFGHPSNRPRSARRRIYIP